MRELQNLVEHSLIQSQTATSDTLSLELNPAGTGRHRAPEESSASREAILPFDTAVGEIIRRALLRSEGKLTGPGSAAELLQLNPSTLRGKMRKLGIQAVSKVGPAG